MARSPNANTLPIQVTQPQSPLDCDDPYPGKKHHHHPNPRPLLNTTSHRPPQHQSQFPLTLSPLAECDYNQRLPTDPGQHLHRLLPNKRSLFASVFALGSSGLGILRWATGHWLPDLNQLLHSPATLAYLLCSTLVGAAVTYVYGGTDNPRINTVVRAGLQLSGLALMYSGMWTHVGAFAAAAATAVLGHVVVPGIARWV